MVATLLAHSRLFKAGIARSGAYNRTLTPFGYQAEERTFWDCPEVYLKNSPFAYANKIEDPLLLIHGADDPNSGTYVMQSERMFAALQGLGKEAKLIVLPCERHNYEIKENILHVVAEQDLFLMKYVVGQDNSKL
jgi:dipeptidyl aminopeptidase/acylaminoacyl peptidase